MNQVEQKRKALAKLARWAALAVFLFFAFKATFGRIIDGYFSARAHQANIEAQRLANIGIQQQIELERQAADRKRRDDEAAAERERDEIEDAESRKRQKLAQDALQTLHERFPLSRPFEFSVKLSEKVRASVLCKIWNEDQFILTRFEENENSYYRLKTVHGTCVLQETTQFKGGVPTALWTLKPESENTTCWIDIAIVPSKKSFTGHISVEPVKRPFHTRCDFLS